MSQEQPDALTPKTAVMAHRFARRSERLEPVYASTRFTLTWSFRIGAALLLVGIVLALIQQQPLNHVTEGFDEVFPSVLRGDAAGVVDLAILWLMASPVFAVLVITAGFFRLGERKYALISVLVLAVLGASIALALAR
jgi:hypothetical protein